MLAAELRIELIFEFGQGSVGLAWYRDCASLIFSRVRLDVVLKGIVVDII